jgi:hypothetical protein
VLGHRGPAHVGEVAGDLPGGQLVAAHQTQDAPAGGVGYRFESVVDG